MSKAERAVRGIETILLSRAPRFCRVKGLTDAEVREIARLLTEVAQVPGIQVGDGNTQHNTFGGGR